MTKQEQIDEMAKIIDDRLIEANLWLGSMNKGKGYWIAEKLIEHYQPKLPKDSVVLSKEEYEDYKKHVDNCIEEYYRGQHEAEVYYKNIQISRERKETAEKILNDLVKNCQYTFNIDGKPIVELDGDFVLNAAKSYGIKIKE